MSVYLHDTFQGAAGTPLTSHTADSGATWPNDTNHLAGVNAIQLDGNGRIFLSGGSSANISSATMPATKNVQILFDFVRLSKVVDSYTGITVFVTYPGFADHYEFTYDENSQSIGFNWWHNGGGQVGWFAGPAPGVTWRIKLDIVTSGGNTIFTPYYSTDSGTTYTAMGNWWSVATPSTPLAIGPYFSGTPCTATTGTHIGNLVVQDIPPPPPAAKLSTAYVGTSGKTIACFFTKLSDGSAVIPTSSVTAPTVYQNGVSLGQLTNPWVTGYHQCAVYCLPTGSQINAGDTVSVSAPSLWMNTSTGSTQAASNVTIANYTGRSAFGTDSLYKTFKPGLNFSDLGTSYQTLYQVTKNLRYRLDPMLWSGNTVDGYPTAMYQTYGGTRICTFDYMPNNLDSTLYPGLGTGLYAVGWDDKAFASSPTQFTITTQSPTQTTITERGDLRNYGTNGIGQVRVFDVEYTAGAPTANLPIDLTWLNALKTPQVSNLFIYGPGDFTYTNGVPVVLDKSDPYALCATFLDRLQYGAGCMRWMDSTIGFGGNTNLSEPWELRNLADFSWGNSNRVNYPVGYTSARPLNLSNSPYIYSEWFGSPYTATLASGIDNQTTSLTISDAATAPVFAGLLLSIDSELMRVRSVAGTAVTVERGSSNTTAAAHSAGSIQVKNRLAFTSFSQIAGPHTGVVEFVTQIPHGLKSGQLGSCNGDGWPTFTFTDSSTFNFQNYSRTVFVTGPNKFVVNIGVGNSASAVTLGSTYTLTPANQYHQWALPPTGFPYDFIALTTSKFAGTNLHVNIPAMASDSFCYEVARRIKNNFVPGRKVYVELADEPWNYGSGFPMGEQFNWMGSLAGYASSEFYVVRSGQIWQIFKNVFGSRGAEIIGIFNCQFVNPGGSAYLLSLARNHSIPVGAIGIAPYIDPDNSIASQNAWNAADIQQGIDLWVHDLYYSRGTNNFWDSVNGHVANIASYNAATQGNCKLYGYEGGIESTVPGSASHVTEGTRDMVFDPNWYNIEKDFYALLQTAGFVDFNLYAYAIYYNYSANWGIYHCPAQGHGRGDGSDGKANNRLCLATPGLPHTKAATTNQDAQNVSVRGQALLDWMHATVPKKRLKLLPSSRMVSR